MTFIITLVFPFKKFPLLVCTHFYYVLHDLNNAVVYMHSYVICDEEMNTKVQGLTFLLALIRDILSSIDACLLKWYC